MMNKLGIRKYYGRYSWVTFIEAMEKFECAIKNNLFLELENFYFLFIKKCCLYVSIFLNFITL